jgi:geranylgeranyl pyrophosphate synthase
MPRRVGRHDTHASMPVSAHRQPAHQCWYQPLLKLAAKDIGRAEWIAGGPFQGPRAGLGAAVASLVARRFGRDPWPQGLAAGLAALEKVNAHSFGNGQDETAWLAPQLSDPAIKMLRTHAGRIDRILQHWFNGFDPDQTVDEAVLFLRAAVSVGVLFGDVPGPVHTELDHIVTHLGLAWERANAKAQGDSPEPGDPLADLHTALRRLPQAAPFGLSPEPTGTTRRIQRWTPHQLPTLTVRPPSPPTALQGVAERWLPSIESAMDDWARQQGRCVYDALRFVQQRGGKRMRPLLTIVGALAAGVQPDPKLAALIEQLHQASLILDDQMDQAATRRGAPTLHTLTSEGFAAGVAMLSLTTIHREGQRLPGPAAQAFAHTTAMLAEGQRNESHVSDEADWEQVIAAKTASLFALSASLGPLVLESPDHVVQALAGYGHALGMAFQVVDDLLDIQGDEATLGKPVGIDAANDRRTLPYLLAASMSMEEAQQATLERALAWRDRAIQSLVVLQPSAHRDILAATADAAVERVQ